MERLPMKHITTSKMIELNFNYFASEKCQQNISIITDFSKIEKNVTGPRAPSIVRRMIYILPKLYVLNSMWFIFARRNVNAG